MRPLSAYEAVIASRTDNHIYHTFTVGSTYNVPLSVDIVLDTLALICQQYPQFSLRVGEGYTCEFTKNMYTINESFIDVINSNELETKLDYYVKYKFDFNADAPLWKILYVKDVNSIYFIMEHTYFDGTAAKNFHETFSKNINSVPDTREIDPSKFAEYPDPTVLMRFKSRVEKPALMKEVPESISVELDKNLLKQPMSVHNKKIVNLGPVKTSQLLQLCRANNIKLTAFFYAVVAKSLCIVIPNTEDKVYKAMIPINTRPKDVPHEIVQFGLYFGKYFHEETAESILTGDVFKLARSFQRLLTENISKAMNGYEEFETKAKENPALVVESMQAMASRNATPLTTVSMSNIGVINSEIIEEVYFDQPLVDAYFAMHFVSSSRRGLSLNFESHRAISKDLFENYANKVLEFVYNI